jgi:glycerol-3-phosphate acyltransferase PlsY
MPPVFLLIWLGAYLVGAIPFGYLVARWRGVDIFQSGSGNIGATNVGRVLGKKFGILVFLFDFAKGALPVAAALAMKNELAGPEISGRGWLEVGAGLAAFLGHLFPVYLRFRGGKGVATGAGVVAVLLPGPALGAVLAWVTVAAATNYVSLASLAAAAVLVCLHVLGTAPLDMTDPRTLFCVLAGALVFVKHRANIARLLQGTENKIQGGNAMRKVLHVLALGLWFGSAAFFTFVVALSLFGTFEELGKTKQEDRPAWFPLPETYAKIDAEINGPKEQGTRAAGYAVGPLFNWYFLLQGLCAFIAAWTSLAWTRENPRVKIHKRRTTILVLAMVTVLTGWPLEHKVAALREPRNQAVDAYLRAGIEPSTEALEKMRTARSDFGRWHFYSLLLNFATLILVTGAMALGGSLPAGREGISLDT